MSINITDALIAVINAVSTSNTEVNTSDSRLLPTGVWANALTLDGVQVAETDINGKWKSEDWGEWKRALPMLDELASQPEVLFDLKDVFDAREGLIKRLVGESFGRCQEAAPEAVATNDPEANLLGEACELLAGKESFGETMFAVKGKMKGDTHTRVYGFRFYQVPNGIGCIHMYRQIRDIRPNREGRWQKHEINGTHMIAYKNAKTGWGWDKRTVGFWSDMVASFDWSPEEMERYVGDHPFYQLLMG